jgi:hypothetical protein
MKGDSHERLVEGGFDLGWVEKLKGAQESKGTPFLKNTVKTKHLTFTSRVLRLQKLHRNSM